MHPDDSYSSVKRENRSQTYKQGRNGWGFHRDVIVKTESMQTLFNN